MDIKAIQNIVNQELPDNIKREMIISILAADKQVIPTMLKILQAEREDSNALITESNLELSRALVTLEDPNVGKKKPKPVISLPFVTGEIRKHYLKWQHRIKCCFKMKGLP